jgi:hypothetical protein
MGRPLIDVTGRRFGRLVVLELTERLTAKRRRVVWLCQCDCGAKPLVSGSHLLSGKTKSCGCFRVDVRTTHGMTGTAIHSIWLAMLDRCRNPNHPEYRYYGGRGVKTCERWLIFANFYADVGDPPEGMTLDRYPNRDGDYEPTNWRWATYSQQVINTDRVDNAVGVIRHGRGFRAIIERNGHRLRLGTFNTEEEAIAIRRKVKETLDTADAIIAHTLLALPAVAGPLPDRTKTPGTASTMTTAQLCASSFTTQSIRDVDRLVVVSNHGRFSRRSRALQMRIVSVLRGWSRRTLAIIFPNPIFSVPSLDRGRKR